MTYFQMKGPIRIGFFYWVQFLLIGAILAGCAAPPPPAAAIPNTGSEIDAWADAELMAVETSAAVFRVIEYPLVEQSYDNPDNPGFADHAIQAVAARRSGFGLFRPVDIVEAPNKVLAPYGYHIAHSTTPPFSSYVLHHNGTPVIVDISRFWQVDADSVADFLLIVETNAGELMAASAQSVELIASTGALEDDRLAYAGSGGMLLNGVDAQTNVPGAIYQQQVDGKPLVLYHRDRLVHLSYDGQELMFTYDAVLYGGGPESAQYIPGSSGSIMWFYALRDGLWYYVEAGLLE